MYALAQQIEGDKEQSFLNVISTDCCNKCEAIFKCYFFAQTTSFIVVPSGHITDDWLHLYFLFGGSECSSLPPDYSFFPPASQLLLFVYSSMVCSQSLKLHCYLSKELSLRRIKLLFLQQQNYSWVLSTYKKQKIFSEKQKGFRYVLSYSTLQKNKETRGNVITQPQSHPIKNPIKK